MKYFIFLLFQVCFFVRSAGVVLLESHISAQVAVFIIFVPEDIEKLVTQTYSTSVINKDIRASKEFENETGKIYINDI